MKFLSNWLDRNGLGSYRLRPADSPIQVIASSLDYSPSQTDLLHRQWMGSLLRLQDSLVHSFFDGREDFDRHVEAVRLQENCFMSSADFCILAELTEKIFVVISYDSSTRKVDAIRYVPQLCESSNRAVIFCRSDLAYFTVQSRRQEDETHLFEAASPWQPPINVSAIRARLSDEAQALRESVTRTVFTIANDVPKIVLDRHTLHRELNKGWRNYVKSVGNYLPLLENSRLLSRDPATAFVHLFLVQAYNTSLRLFLRHIGVTSNLGSLGKWDIVRSTSEVVGCVVPFASAVGEVVAALGDYFSHRQETRRTVEILDFISRDEFDNVDLFEAWFECAKILVLVYKQQIDALSIEGVRKLIQTMLTVQFQHFANSRDRSLSCSLPRVALFALWIESVDEKKIKNRYGQNWKINLLLKQSGLLLKAKNGSEHRVVLLDRGKDQSQRYGYREVEHEDFQAFLEYCQRINPDLCQSYTLQRRTSLTLHQDNGEYLLAKVEKNDLSGVEFYLFEQGDKESEFSFQRCWQHIIDQRFFALMPVFVKHGVDLDAPIDRTGATALHIAAQKKWQTVFAWLLKVGADAGIKDRQGNYPDYYCPVNKEEWRSLRSTCESNRQIKGMAVFSELANSLPLSTEKHDLIIGKLKAIRANEIDFPDQYAMAFAENPLFKKIIARYHERYAGLYRQVLAGSWPIERDALALRARRREEYEAAQQKESLTNLISDYESKQAKIDFRYQVFSDLLPTQEISESVLRDIFDGDELSNFFKEVKQQTDLRQLVLRHLKAELDAIKKAKSSAQSLKVFFERVGWRIEDVRVFEKVVSEHPTLPSAIKHFCDHDDDIKRSAVSILKEESISQTVLLPTLPRVTASGGETTQASPIPLERTVTKENTAALLQRLSVLNNRLTARVEQQRSTTTFDERLLATVSKSVP